MWPFRNKAQHIEYRRINSHHLEPKPRFTENFYYQLRFANRNVRNGACEGEP